MKRTPPYNLILHELFELNQIISQDHCRCQHFQIFGELNELPVVSVKSPKDLSYVGVASLMAGCNDHFFELPGINLSRPIHVDRVEHILILLDHIERQVVSHVLL